MKVNSSTYLKTVLFYTAISAITLSYLFRSALLVLVGLGLPLVLNYGKITGRFENINVTLLSISVAPLVILIGGYIVTENMRAGGGSAPALTMMVYMFYMVLSAFYGLTISLPRVFLVKE